MPPTKTTESIWKKYMTIIRDMVFIFLFLVSIVGWIRSETKKATKLETNVETLLNNDAIQTEQLEKINDILMEQKELNGKIIQYMQQR
jgi:hypothetical protein